MVVEVGGGFVWKKSYNIEGKDERAASNLISMAIYLTSFLSQHCVG